MKNPRNNGTTSLWYLKLIGQDYNPNNYVYAYDTSELVDGNMLDNSFTPWISKTAGYDKGRYVPTVGFGAFGVGGPHYNFTKGVEGQSYYQKFGEDLLNENGEFTDMGKQWAKAVDALIPPSNHLARFYDDKGNLRTSWTTGHNDVHGRAPKTYNNLADYVKAIRNDLILGARHNVFLNKGKRYFYKDLNGIEHWVNPDDIGNYTVGKTPARSNWNDDHTVYWDDYELTGLIPQESPDTSKEKVTKGDSITGEHTEGFDWSKAKKNILKIAPGLLGAGRLAYALDTNRRMYNERLKGIVPLLLQSYHTHRQVVGDEATKQAYYRRAAEGETAASRPFTSDADRQIAYLMEAKRVGDELRSQGDLADNQEIRRTSDESNQHQWQNIARDNLVANSNYLALLHALSDRQKLKANKIAADFTSVNNYLTELETRLRLRQSEKLTLFDQISALDYLNELLNDSKYNSLYKEMTDAYEEAMSKNDLNALKAAEDLNFKKKKLAFNNYKYSKQRQYYADMLNRRSFYKKGGMFTYTKNDNLLYKTARDAVKHYEKMVKLTDDSTHKSFKKPLNVIKPPKSTTRKMLTGGVAPFVVYTPAPIGGETTTSSLATAGETTSKSKKEEGNSPIDIIKDLFKNLEGLPSDVNGVYLSMSNFLARAKAFGTEISSDDLANMYLRLMLQINNIKFSKAAYDKTKELAVLNDALNEIAVNYAGLVAVQDDKGISFMSWEDAKKSGKTPLTNNGLLNLRAYIPNFQFNDGILDVVNNGIGVTKIADFIQSHLPSLGNREETILGYTKKQSNQIREGFEQLLSEAPDGDYHWSRKTLEQKLQIEMALGYISTILPRNMKAILNIHADLLGITPTDMLETLLKAKESTVNDLALTAVTGKAAAKNNNNPGSTQGDIKSNFLDLILRDQIGTPRKFSLITRDGNSELYSLNSKYISQLPNVTEDMSLDKMLNESKVGSILDSRLGITFGDQVISPENFKDIMFDIGGGATIVTLPCKWENGHKVVNFGIKDSFDLAVKEAERIIPVDYSNPRFQQVLALKLKEKNLDSLVSGNSLDPNMFGHFMVVSAYTSDKIKFDYNSRYIEKVKNPDKALEDRLIRGLSTNKDKNDYKIDVDDTFGWFEGTWDDIYRGSVFIPLNNDPVSALTGWGNDNIKLDETLNLANQYQIWDKMSKMKSSNSNLL